MEIRSQDELVPLNASALFAVNMGTLVFKNYSFCMDLLNAEWLIHLPTFLSSPGG